MEITPRLNIRIKEDLLRRNTNGIKLKTEIMKRLIISL
jgi:hypothetical protein